MPNKTGTGSRQPMLAAFWQHELDGVGGDDDGAPNGEPRLGAIGAAMLVPARS